MTDPIPAPPVGPAPNTVNAGIEIERGADGTYQPRLVFTVGGTMVEFKIRLSSADADKFMAQVAQGMAEATAKCRQLNSGLLTPDDLARQGQPVPGLPPMPGRPLVGPLGLPRG